MHYPRTQWDKILLWDEIEFGIAINEFIKHKLIIKYNFVPTWSNESLRIIRSLRIISTS